MAVYKAYLMNSDRFSEETRLSLENRGEVSAAVLAAVAEQKNELVVPGKKRGPTIARAVSAGAIAPARVRRRRAMVLILFFSMPLSLCAGEGSTSCVDASAAVPP